MCISLTAPRVDRWERERSKLNHDWLKNEYLPRLGTWLNVLNGHVSRWAEEPVFVRQVLPQWADHRDAIRAMLDECANALSPVRVLEAIELPQRDPDTFDWLGGLIHALWLKRSGVRDIIGHAQDCLRRADAAYRCIQEVVSEYTEQELAQAFMSERPGFEALEKACSELADAITSLPHRTRVL